MNRAAILGATLLLLTATVLPAVTPTAPGAIMTHASAQGTTALDGTACANATGDASCDGVAVSGTGDASSNGTAASGTGNSSAAYAVAGGGDANGTDLAASGTGDASGWRAVSGTGNASACRDHVDCLEVSGGSVKRAVAVSVKDDAHCEDASLPPLADDPIYTPETPDIPCLAASVTGNATGTLAASGTGEGSGEVVATSGTGNAECDGRKQGSSHSSFGLESETPCGTASATGNATSCEGIGCTAASGTGTATGWAAASGTGDAGSYTALHDEFNDGVLNETDWNVEGGEERNVTCGEYYLRWSDGVLNFNGTGSSERSATTRSLDVRRGGHVSVGVNSCGGDGATAVVALQYSTDGASTWTTIHEDSVRDYSWTYTPGTIRGGGSFSIPPQARTADTEFRLIQTNTVATDDVWIAGFINIGFDASIAVSGAGNATADDIEADGDGVYADGVEATEDGLTCFGVPCVAVDPGDDAHGYLLGVSGNGNASSCTEDTHCLAVSGTGTARGHHAVSGTGPASGATSASGTGDSGAYTAFQDGFEDGEVDEGNWTVENGEETNLQCSWQHPSVLNFNGTDSPSRSATTRELDVRRGGKVTFTLGQGCDFETNLSARVHLQYTTSGASGWTTLGGYWADWWEGHGVEIPEEARSSDTRFRWVQTNGERTSAAWALDSVHVGTDAADHAVSGTGNSNGTVAGSGDGDASSCGSYECAAASGTGDSSGNQAVSGTGDVRGDWAAVSGTGNASGEYVGMSGMGDARCTGGSISVYPCPAVTGGGDANGQTAMSGGGDASGSHVATSGTGDANCRGEIVFLAVCPAASGTGDAAGRSTASSGTGNATCDPGVRDSCIAAGGDNANGTIAVAGLGDAECTETAYILLGNDACVATSGGGDANGTVAVSVLGNATCTEACVSVAPTARAVVDYVLSIANDPGGYVNYRVNDTVELVNATVGSVTNFIEPILEEVTDLLPEPDEGAPATLGHLAVDYAEATYRSAWNIVTAGTYEDGGFTSTWENMTRSLAVDTVGPLGGTAWDTAYNGFDSYFMEAFFYAFYSEDTPFYNWWTNPARYTLQNASAYAGGQGGMQVLILVSFGPVEGVPHPCQVDDGACVTDDDAFEAGHMVVEAVAGSGTNGSSGSELAARGTGHASGNVDVIGCDTASSVGTEAACWHVDPANLLP